MKDDKLYLIHITECLERIEQFVTEGKEVFVRDLKTQDAVIRNLQVLAESSQRLSETLKTAHPEVNWRGLAGFRNILVHDYLGINLQRVWEIIEGDLPALKRQMTSLRQACENA